MIHFSSLLTLCCIFYAVLGEIYNLQNGNKRQFDEFSVNSSIAKRLIQGIAEQFNGTVDDQGSALGGALTEGNNYNNGNNNEAEEFSESKHKILGQDDNINEYVDTLVDNVNKEIQAKRKDSYPLPDLSWSHETTIWRWKVKLGLIAKNGLLLNLSTIFRAGDSYLIQHEQDGVSTAIIPVGLKLCSAQYEAYEITMLGRVFSTGKLTATVQETSAIFHIEVRIPQCVARVEKVTLNKFSNLEVNFSGLNSINNFIANQIGNGLLRSLQGKIKEIVEAKLFEWAQEGLKDRDVCNLI